MCGVKNPKYLPSMYFDWIGIKGNMTHLQSIAGDLEKK